MNKAEYKNLKAMWAKRESEVANRMMFGLMSGVALIWLGSESFVPGLLKYLLWAVGAAAIGIGLLMSNSSSQRYTQVQLDEWEKAAIEAQP